MRALLPEGDKKFISQAHADLYNLFVAPSYSDYQANQYGQDAIECLSRLEEVLGNSGLGDAPHDLYSRVESTFLRNALSRNLRSFFEGKDKLIFGLKHVRMLFRAFGYDFSIMSI